MTRTPTTAEPARRTALITSSLRKRQRKGGSSGGDAVKGAEEAGGAGAGSPVAGDEPGGDRPRAGAVVYASRPHKTYRDDPDPSRHALHATRGEDLDLPLATTAEHN